MHGEGAYTDIEGRKWEGEFVEGVYKSKLQKQLKMEKLLKKKEAEVLENVEGFFNRWSQTFAASDKKTFKENLPPFFALSDEIKQYVKEPYARYEERTPDKWYFNLIHSSPVTNCQERLLEVPLRAISSDSYPKKHRRCQAHRP